MLLLTVPTPNVGRLTSDEPAMGVDGVERKPFDTGFTSVLIEPDDSAGVKLDMKGLLDELGPVPQVAVVLVDGMGHELLPAMAPHAPLLAELMARGPSRRLECTFPATTPTSLVSLGTGERPGRHGVLVCKGDVQLPELR